MTSSRKPAARLAVGYIRVSTNEQCIESLSLESQERKIRAWAELHSLDLVDVVSDPGRSGKNLHRRGLEGIIERCRSRQIGTVIVCRLDRLSRRTKDLLNLVEDVFAAHEIEFVSIQERIDTTTAQGKFFLTLMGAMAQMERDQISERTSDALAHLQARGEIIGSAPLGFRKVSNLRGKLNSLAPDPDEQGTVLLARRLRRRGLGYHEIARRLRSEGLKTKRGGAWWPSTVRYMLLNPIYRPKNEARA